MSGGFSAAGNIATSAVGAYDPVVRRWVDLNLDLSAFVSDLAVSPAGDLYVAANFSPPSTGPLLGRVFRWNGSAWTQLGGTFDSYVRDLAFRPSGELIAVGDFTTSGSADHIGVAKWDGAAWSAIDGAPRRASKIASRPNGSVVIYGSFPSPQGDERLAIALWNGANWSEIAAQVGTVNTLVAAPNGDVFAAGNFQSIAGVAASSIARWSDGQWSALAGGIGGIVRSLELLPDGRLLAAGEFTSAGTVIARKLALWDGSAWSDPAPTRIPSDSVLSPSTLYTVSAVSTQSIFIAGAFNRLDSIAANNIAQWDGQGWQSLATGTNAKIVGLSRLLDGSLLATGDFTSIEGVSLSYLARWDGSQWSSPAAPLSGPVKAAAQLANGDLIVSGGFQLAAGSPLVRVARWDGSQWSAFGQLSSAPTHFAVLPNGDVMASASWPRTPPGSGSALPRFIRWNGTSWASTSDTINFNTLAGFLVLPSGELLAAGWFSFSGGGPDAGVIRWNGSTWSAVDAASMPRATALALLPTGEIIAAKAIENPNFSSSAVLYALSAQTQTWQQLSAPVSNVINHIVPLSNGSLLALGDYFRVDNRPISVFVGTWNGQGWRTLPQSINLPASAVEVMPNGTIVLAGEFTTAARQPSAYIARLTLPSSCPCDSLDFNGDGLFPSDADVIDLFSVLAGNACSTGTCSDIDFNNDGLFPDDSDLIAFLRVLAGGAC